MNKYSIFHSFSLAIRGKKTSRETPPRRGRRKQTEKKERPKEQNNEQQTWRPKISTKSQWDTSDTSVRGFRCRCFRPGFFIKGWFDRSHSMRQNPKSFYDSVHPPRYNVVLHPRISLSYRHSKNGSVVKRRKALSIWKEQWNFASIRFNI